MHKKSNSFEKDKQAMLSRRRRLIFNNDGGDVVKRPEKRFDQPRDFLRIRTTPLKGSHAGRRRLLRYHRD